MRWEQWTEVVAETDRKGFNHHKNELSIHCFTSIQEITRYEFISQEQSDKFNEETEEDIRTK